MILITDIEYREVPNDIYEIWHKKHDTSAFYEDISLIKEVVNGVRFVNECGQEVCIGMSSNVQNILGLSFNTYQNLQEENNNLTENCDRLRKEYFKLQNKLKRVQHDKEIYKKSVLEFENMSFWERLKFLLEKIGLSI